MAADITQANQIRMLQGDFVHVSGARLTDAVERSSNITSTDVTAANGVIHVIDSVLLPFQP